MDLPSVVFPTWFCPRCNQQFPNSMAALSCHRLGAIRRVHQLVPYNAMVWALSQN